MIRNYERGKYIFYKKKKLKKKYKVDFDNRIFDYFFFYKIDEIKKKRKYKTRRSLKFFEILDISKNYKLIKKIFENKDYITLTNLKKSKNKEKKKVIFFDFLSRLIFKNHNILKINRKIVNFMYYDNYRKKTFNNYKYQKFFVNTFFNEGFFTIIKKLKWKWSLNFNVFVYNNNSSYIFSNKSINIKKRRKLENLMRFFFLKKKNILNFNNNELKKFNFLKKNKKNIYIFFFNLYIYYYFLFDKIKNNNNKLFLNLVKNKYINLFLFRLEYLLYIKENNKTKNFIENYYYSLLKENLIFIQDRFQNDSNLLSLIFNKIKDVEKNKIIKVLKNEKYYLKIFDKKRNFTNINKKIKLKKKLESKKKFKLIDLNFINIIEKIKKKKIKLNKKKKNKKIFLKKYKLKKFCKIKICLNKIKKLLNKQKIITLKKILKNIKKKKNIIKNTNQFFENLTNFQKIVKKIFNVKKVYNNELNYININKIYKYNKLDLFSFLFFYKKKKRKIKSFYIKTNKIKIEFTKLPKINLDKYFNKNKSKDENKIIKISKKKYILKLKDLEKIKRKKIYIENLRKQKIIKKYKFFYYFLFSYLKKRNKLKAKLKKKYKKIKKKNIYIKKKYIYKKKKIINKNKIILKFKIKNKKIRTKKNRFTLYLLIKKLKKLINNKLEKKKNKKVNNQKFYKKKKNYGSFFRPSNFVLKEDIDKNNTIHYHIKDRYPYQKVLNYKQFRKRTKRLKKIEKLNDRIFEKLRRKIFFKKVRFNKPFSLEPHVSKRKKKKKILNQKLFRKVKFQMFFNNKIKLKRNKNYIRRKIKSLFKNSNKLNEAYGNIYSRIDVILYNLDFFKTIGEIHSLIKKKIISVNGKKIKHIKYNLKNYDILKILYDFSYNLNYDLINLFYIYYNKEKKGSQKKPKSINYYKKKKRKIYMKLLKKIKNNNKMKFFFKKTKLELNKINKNINKLYKKKEFFKYLFFFYLKKNKKKKKIIKKLKNWKLKIKKNKKILKKRKKRFKKEFLILIRIKYKNIIKKILIYKKKIIFIRFFFSKKNQNLFLKKLRKKYYKIELLKFLDVIREEEVMYRYKKKGYLSPGRPNYIWTTWIKKESPLRKIFIEKFKEKQKECKKEIKEILKNKKKKKEKIELISKILKKLKEEKIKFVLKISNKMLNNKKTYELINKKIKRNFKKKFKKKYYIEFNKNFNNFKNNKNFFKFFFKIFKILKIFKKNSNIKIKNIILKRYKNKKYFLLNPPHLHYNYIYDYYLFLRENIKTWNINIKEIDFNIMINSVKN